jgi:hypothetical protein
MYVGFDIVGLDSESHGQFCMQDLCYSHSVKEKQCIVLHLTNRMDGQLKMIDNSASGELEEIVQVYKVAEDGLAYCHVGYLPKCLFWKYGSSHFDKMFVHVPKDYQISNSYEQKSVTSFLGNGIRKDHMR